MEDRDISCMQCGKSFIFTHSEQERFHILGFDEPKRCAECRKKKAGGALSPQKEKVRNKRRRYQWE
ncbi:MAG: zinc-ribbon domain containing protein [Syntrophobacteria bacterium]